MNDAFVAMTWNITLTKRPDTALGLDVDTSAGKYLIVRHVAEGEFSRWNHQHAVLAIRPGDKIIRVNDCTGPADAMIVQCMKSTRLEFCVERKQGVR